jgi:hypothetical protein
VATDHDHYGVRFRLADTAPARVLRRRTRDDGDLTKTGCLQPVELDDPQHTATCNKTNWSQ